MTRLTPAVMFSAFLSLPVLAAPPMPQCESERYFAPTDSSHGSPLTAAHPEFLAYLKGAHSGNAQAQRNAAIAYEKGYLVDACTARALYWFEKAAAGGDKVAKDWLARQEVFARFRQGPECAGSTCPDFESGVQIMELYADTGGHFRAPVTIRDRTVTGIIDTGATFVSMSADTARAMGIPYLHGRKVTMMTANGTKAASIVIVDAIRVGGILLNDVPVAVSEGNMPILVGMSFLGRLNVSINMGRMSLAKP